MSSTSFVKNSSLIGTALPSLSADFNTFPNITLSSISRNNNTGDGTFSLSFPAGLKICLYSLYFLIFLFGTLGNFLVCYIIGVKTRKQSSGDIFIVSLAAADLLASVFIPVLMITDMASDFKVWYFGEIGCHILPSISPVTLVASSWSLVAISLDRYRENGTSEEVNQLKEVIRQLRRVVLMLKDQIEESLSADRAGAINKPLSLKLPRKIKIFGLLFIWIIAVGSCMPYTLALGMEGNFCWAEGFSSRKIAVVWCGCFLLIGWIIPIIVMTGLYTLMARKLKMGEKRHANNPDSFDRIRKENRRVAKMFTTIVCIFFLLTMPYSAFYFTLAYLEYAGPPNKGEHDRLLQANYGLFVLTLINCSTNPLIYARMHSKVREAMNMYFCCGKIFQNRQKNDNLLTEL